jgi:hypothetical protein
MNTQISFPDCLFFLEMAPTAFTFLSLVLSRGREKQQSIKIYFNKTAQDMNKNGAQQCLQCLVWVTALFSSSRNQGVK